MKGDEGVQQDGFERATLRRIAWRLMPLLTLGYLVSFVDAPTSASLRCR